MNLSRDIENYDKHYFEITRQNNEIIFHLKNSIMFTTNFLIITHRKSGKRLIKKLKNSKVSVSTSEISEFNEFGFFDINLKITSLKNTYYKRIPFKTGNDLEFMDDDNHNAISFYKTVNGNLSFEVTEAIIPKLTGDDFKLTAVVLVYNGQPYLKECLNSLVNQTLDGLEILLINDASTDDSLEVCREFEENYDNVFLINKPENKGLSHSANLGIELAKGEYVILVDNDDIIPNDAYEKLYNNAKQTGADVSVGRANFFTKYQMEMNFLDITPWKKESIVTDITEFPEMFYDVFYWNKIIKKDLLIENQIKMPTEIKIYADRCFTHKVYSCAKKISIIPDCVYLWRKRTDSLSRIRFDIENFNDRMNAYDYDLDYLSDCYNDYFNTLFRRALIPIKGILESFEFEELFFKRILKLFEKGQKKVDNIYDNDFVELHNIYTFLILNGHVDELKELLQLDLKKEVEILNDDGKSYWKLPPFRNPKLNIPDDLFEIKYLREQFISVDKITIDDDFIVFDDIELPKYFELSKGEIILKGRANSKQIYDEFCYSQEVEQIENNLYRAKIPLSALHSYEVYAVNFRFENKFGLSRDVKLSNEYIGSIVNDNSDIDVLINSYNHIFLIIHYLESIFEMECDSEKLRFKVYDSNRVKRDFKLFYKDKNSDKQLFFDSDDIKSEYVLKWKFFLDENSDYELFMRIYNEEGKLNKIVNIDESYVKDFNDVGLTTDEDISVEVYKTDDGSINFKSV